ncbi:MAG: SDR family oxidoreductase [Acidobacteria bacterium]|nr:SDR family oxidoreductase [Acidobacteriota bacterium]
MDLALDGKVVFITGAAGGIGRVLAEAFAGEGARLVLTARAHLDDLRSFVVEQDWGDRALALGADVTVPEDLDGAVERALAQFGRVDACVANAGVWPPEALRLDLMPAARLRSTIETDLLGAAFTARAFFRALARTGPRADGDGAALTFIGSTAGRFGEAFHADYSASKAALYGLVRSLKNEIVQLDRYGRVNMVEPGWTVTPMARAALAEPGGIAQVLRTMPVRQLARPVDIARAVLFLSSPAAARHVSGEVVTVAGGMEGRVQWEPGDIDVPEVLRRLG